MVNSHHTQKSRERIIRTQQTSDKQPFDLRAELNRAYTACMLIVRPLERKTGKRTPAEMALWKKTSARMGEIAEQLEILNWIEFMPELDAEKRAKFIAAFDAETMAMKWEQNELDQHAGEA